MKIYNNWIETTGKHGIQAYTQDGPKVSEGRGPFEVQIFNNVIVDAGGLWKSFMMRSNGINVGAQDGCEEPIPTIYSNTIVNSRQGGINVDNNIDQWSLCATISLRGLEAIRQSHSPAPSNRSTIELDRSR